ncbi:MAG: tetraacyldisaccharide 4'-kinase [Tidjanibacter sp.]|nr:tetraacyldisaccharide 4'-kinase [Tidjanibacter sp.]
MGLFRSIAAGIYRAGVGVRNWLYDIGVLRSRSFEIPIVCVGNIAAGGTGKTPMVEFLVDRLGDQYKIAVLSRGYGRRSKGYREVESGDSYLLSGDEPKQLKRRFPEIPVIVCADRIEGVERIVKEHPEVTLIIMDDGFQHRSISPKVNIVLSDYSLPPSDNRMLPAGTLRDRPSQLFRANILIITKTPADMSPIERNIAQKELRPKPFQSVFFTDVQSENPKPLFPDKCTARVVKGTRIVALAGIANPEPFYRSLSERYEVLDTVRYPDHHTYRVGEVRHLAHELNRLGDDVMLVTTDKDGVKLTSRKHIPKELQSRLFTLPIAVRFRDGDEQQFLDTLKKEIENRL